jgi:excisionase family DNA binding protein
MTPALKMAPRPSDASSDAPRLLFTVEQIEVASGLSGSAVRRAIRSGDLACHRFGRAVRVAEDDYLAWLARHRRGKRRPP